MTPERMIDAARILGGLGYGKMANELTHLADRRGRAVEGCGKRMSEPLRVSETLVISNKYIAERVGLWGVRKWSIWRIADILTKPCQRPVVWWAQTGHDAIQMIQAFEAAATQEPARNGR